jgi:hypothetical protein
MNNKSVLKSNTEGENRMAAAPTLVSLDEYLNTAYEPYRDFVDGVLLQRNVGTQPHGMLQAILAMFFGQYRKSHDLPVRRRRCRLPTAPFRSFSPAGSGRSPRGGALWASTVFSKSPPRSALVLLYRELDKWKLQASAP